LLELPFQELWLSVYYLELYFYVLHKSIENVDETQTDRHTLKSFYICPMSCIA